MFGNRSSGTAMSDDHRMFADRREAGRELAARLAEIDGAANPVVLALPRGGVPVGYEIARGLKAALDVFLVRKLGTPGHQELAMGAIASGGVRVLNDEIVQAFGIRPDQIEAVARREEIELDRREASYRRGRLFPSLSGRTVILVDDGLATGSTMKAAVLAVRHQKPARVIVAVPVGAPDACRTLSVIADDVVCARTPRSFSAVGEWYRDFAQTTDEEVVALLSSTA
jgi:predicted phosphoribosyltransferase